MKVVVFGEDSNLARELVRGLRQDPSVEILNSHDKHPGDLSLQLHSDRAWTPELDAADPEVLEWLRLVEPDLVINTAALVSSRYCYGRETESLYSNTITASSVANVVASMPNTRLVYLATTAAYSGGPETIDEGTPVGFYQTAYTMTKLLGELLTQEVMPPERLLTLRTVLVYGGDRDPASVLAELIKRGLREETEPVTIGLELHARKALLHVDDFVSAVLELIRREAHGTYVIGAPYAGYEYTEVVEELINQGMPAECYDQVTWDGSKDCLQHHSCTPTKLQGAIGDPNWPHLSLAAGISKEIARYKAQLTERY